MNQGQLVNVLAMPDARRAKIGKKYRLASDLNHFFRIFWQRGCVRLAPGREVRQYFWPLNGKHKILSRREVQWNAEPQVGLVLICRWRCRWWLTATRARRS